MRKELRAWLWLMLLGVFTLWWFAGAPPIGPFERKRAVNTGILDDSWECRPVKGGPICWKKPSQNPASPTP
ncbi:hypothetical protein IZ6_05760 [Terrihabitans soli]|uniref:Uncharacterized protein n=1 Tax=Terrihabitans soli TaxID=708113 RepID=A0A6S6QS33_9HYPH|nr:hypothetical protein IZ6_05760 [Terrihabitans soli]